MSRPLVAHALRTWLPRSETFIHGQVVGGERWDACVVARALQEPERFPLGGRAVLLTGSGLGTMARTWAAATRALPRLTAAEGAATARALRTRGARLIHAHFGTDARFLRPLWRRAGLPLVVSFYGYDALQFPRRHFGLGARYLRPALRESARILVPCAEMGADLAALGADPARIEVLPWGVDVARFAPRASAAVADEARFAIVCRFTAKKGVADLLRAFALVRRAGVRARLTVAGDGPLRASYLDLIAELGLGDSVAVAGFVSQERLPAFLAEQHVFVHPSVTTQDGDKEGTPTVLMEAQAAGLPVIATRHAGIPDVVADGVSGHLVAEGDVAALAERMIHCARHPEEWPGLGAAGRARVVAGFERGAQSRRREALYDAVAGG